MAAKAAPRRFWFSFVLLISGTGILTESLLVTAQRVEPRPAGALLLEPAAGDSHGASSPSRRDDRLTLIVQLDGPTILSAIGGAKRERSRSWRADLESPAGRSQRSRIDRDHEAFERALHVAVRDARIVRKLRLALNAIAVTVPDRSAIATIRSLPGVRSVWVDSSRQLQTTRGPTLIGAAAAWTGVGGNITTGNGIVIGVIDSGIWPEHPSFADPGTEGSYGPPPDWTVPACEFGGTPDDAPFACNNKIVGARRMMASYDQQHVLQPGEFASARDDSGHGTDVATVAAGNRNVPAQIRGNPIGTTAGVAPHARLAVYKVCGRSGCYDSDAVAAIEQAIVDGVDVISLAFSGGGDPYNDPLSLALLDAHDAGIFVAAPAGNGGFGALSGRREPWTTVVGATRLDRAFVSTLTLRAGSITTTLFGTSVTTGISAQTPIIDAATAGDANCVASAPADFAGAVVVCARGGNSRAEKSRNVQLRGGVGMILVNPTPSDLSSDNHFVPTIHLDKAHADTLFAFLSTHGSAARASFTAGATLTIPGESVAAFTARGGAGQPLSISKPDLVAPGLFVAGGHSAAPPIEGGPPGESFQVVDGTSIAAAHVVGAAALLKALRPTWTPDHIRSALMLTSATAVANESGQAASPFDIGAGRVNVAAALAPAFAILPAAGEFMAKRDRLWDVNYPALYVARLAGALATQRTLTNLENRQTTWSIQVTIGAPVKISAPTSVTLPPLGTAVVPIIVDGTSLLIDYVGVGSMTFVEVGGTRRLRLPLSVLRKSDALPIDAACTPTTIRVSEFSNCSIKVANMNPQPTAVAVYDTLPTALQLVPGSVVNGSSSGNTVFHVPTLASASPGTIDLRLFPPWDGYTGASAFYPPVACAGSCDDRVFTGTVPLGILFNGQVHTSITISTNGFMQLGTGAAAAPINQSLPDADSPNATLAPFWTDLHPQGTDGQGAGALHVGYVTLPSGRIYLLVEWKDVKIKSSNARHTFEIWLQVGGQVEDVTFSYDRIESLGANGLLTVGAENPDGTIGANYYFNGVGTAPIPQTNIFASSPGPSPGGTHTMTFRVRGQTTGTFTHCAVVHRPGSSEFGTSCVPIVVQP